MKLLVDELWPATLATRLRDRGHDAVAAIERPGLAHQGDDVVFAGAQVERRAVLTENVPDYVPLARDCIERGEAFFGLLLTSNTSFPRGHPRTLGRAVRTLDRLMSERPGERDLLNQIAWLPSSRR